MLHKYTILFGICLLAILLSSTVSAQEAESQQRKSSPIQTLSREGNQQTVNVASEYTVYLHGEPVVFENPPLLVGNHMLVEFRTMFESMGYEIDWDAATKTAIGVKDGQHIEFSVDQSEAIINGEFKSMPVPTRIVNGRTMIPLKFFVEESGYDVQWNAETNTVHLTRDLSEHVSLTSNLTLNGYIEVIGAVNERIQHVRLDITHLDKPHNIENVFLKPEDKVIQQSVYLPSGPGHYSVAVFVTTDNDQYGNYRLLDSYKVVYAENTDLLVLPDNEDRNRYTIRARLSEQAESALLKIKKLDREAFMVLPLDHAELPLIEQEVYLAFGPGVYQVDLFELYQGNQSIRTVTLTHTGNAEIKLSAPSTDNSQVRISGKVSPEMKWMWVQYANPSEDMIRNAFVPIEDGKLEHTLHLNMGKGSYQIKIGLSDEEAYNQGYTSYETFQVENLDTRNRHRLPSETVQSQAESVVTQANEITDELEGEQAKSAAIYNWISEHIELAPHSGEADQIQTATFVLEQGEATRAGMARLSAAMHRAIGIPAKVVSGEAHAGEESQQHYWAEVFVDGRWVVQDLSQSAIMSLHDQNQHVPIDVDYEKATDSLE